MALTKLNSLAIPASTIVTDDLTYPLTNFSSTGIDDNATSTAITIDADENIKIATDGASTSTSKSLYWSSSSFNRADITVTNLSTYAADMHFSTGNNASYAKRMTLSSLGDLGLGTVAPVNSNDYSTIDIRGTNGGQMLMGRNTNMDAFMFTESSQFTVGSGTGCDLVFKTNSNGGNNEALRIDTGGNLLVGTDSVSGFLNSTTETGSISYSDGKIAATASSDAAAYFKRLTDNGPIIYLRNSSAATVGSIGIEGGDSLYTQGGTTAGAGLLFHGAAAKILPLRNGASIDATIDLGQDSRRFKDLYLSGDIQHKDNAGNARVLYDRSADTLGNQGTNGSFYSIYLGGTAAANRLDDYEEGNWTPNCTTRSGAFTVYNARYTRVGQTVTVHGYFDWLSNNQNNNGNQFFLGGLPFDLAASGHYTAGAVGYSGGVDISDWYLVVLPNTDNFYFTKRAVAANVTNAEMHSKGLRILIVSITYITDA